MHKRIEMDKKIGIIREVDSLGRVVIPKEIRKTYKLEREVEIISTGDGVLLRNPKYNIILVEKEQDV